MALWVKKKKRRLGVCFADDFYTINESSLAEIYQKEISKTLCVQGEKVINNPKTTEYVIWKKSE